MVVYEQVFPPKNDNLRRMSLSPRPVLLKRIDTLSVSASGKRRERRCIKRTSLGLSIFVTLHTSDPYNFKKWKPLCSCGEESALFQKCKYSRKCHTLSIKIISSHVRNIKTSPLPFHADISTTRAAIDKPSEDLKSWRKSAQNSFFRFSVASSVA